MALNPTNLENIRAAYLNKVPSGDFFPSVFVLEPISNCNLACVMCPNSKLGPEKLGHISLEEFKSVVSKIAPYAEHVMLYFMGEPLHTPKLSGIN